ncbi:hypothetical protein BER2_4121 [plant metagenome]|uniref:Uncharacterized protein n=1 Tax=plant metagenome TaxID=1297885 RepID=A0A484QUQ5_9ZZZZ
MMDVPRQFMRGKPRGNEAEKEAASHPAMPGQAATLNT